jgi:hypothetical protein
MNDMMNMDGNHERYGDANEPTKMDMNTVMYPEISGEAPMMMHGNQVNEDERWI